MVRHSSSSPHSCSAAFLIDLVHLIEIVKNLLLLSVEGRVSGFHILASTDNQYHPGCHLGTSFTARSYWHRAVRSLFLFPYYLMILQGYPQYFLIASIHSSYFFFSNPTLSNLSFIDRYSIPHFLSFSHCYNKITASNSSNYL